MEPCRNYQDLKSAKRENTSIVVHEMREGGGGEVGINRGNPWETEGVLGYISYGCVPGVNIKL